MKLRPYQIYFLVLILFSSNCLSQSGKFFSIAESGATRPLQIELCLSASPPHTCQIFDVNKETLTITTNVPNRTYTAGIRIRNSTDLPTGCTPLENGFCSFSVTPTTTASITNVPASEAATLSISKSSLALSSKGYNVGISSAIIAPLPEVNFLKYGVQSQAGGWPFQIDNGSWGFGAPGFNDLTFSKQGELAFVDDGTPGTNPQGNPISAEGCNALINTNLNGKIAVIYRNSCGFSTKVKNAQAKGAIAAIIINREDAITNMSAGDDGPSVTIPAIFISSVDGATLKTRMDSEATTVSIKHTPRGKARKLTVQNSGLYTANNVTYSATNLPSGTTIMPASCGTLAPAAVCELTITPGATPTATAYDLSPVPANLQVKGANTKATNTELNILTYGSLFQSGFIFNIDDTTTETNSIEGKVVALADAANNISWSGTQGLVNASSYSNGHQNTETIVADPICSDDPNNCAAYQCKFTYNAGGYNNWYLPALFELKATGIDNVAQALPELYTDCTLGTSCFDTLGEPIYWSSTEDSYADPQDIPRDATGMNFSIINSYFSREKTDSSNAYARCIRAIT